MRRLQSNKGFTLAEILVAVLVISIASAALAVSVSSAGKINKGNLQIDSSYVNDLQKANAQQGGSSSSVKIQDGVSSITQDIKVYGDGSLSTAHGVAVPRPTGTTVINVEPESATEEEDIPELKEEEEEIDPDPQEEDPPVDPDPEEPVKPDYGEKIPVSYKETVGIFEFKRRGFLTFGNSCWMLKTDLQPGTLIESGGRYFLVLKPLTKQFLNSMIWDNIGANNLSKRDVLDYYSTYDYNRALSNRSITEISNNIYKVNEYKFGYPKNTVISYQGVCYFSISDTTAEDIPGTSSKWIKINQG